MESVRHRMGTVAIEGGQVVVRLEGRRKRGLLGGSEPWAEEVRVPLEQVVATADGPELTIRRGAQAVQAVVGDPVEFAEFAEAVELAKDRLASPIAACGHCGAPGQRSGTPCSYCGIPVSAPTPGPGG